MNISAEALLTTEADGTQLQTPVFIQPDSDQPCLLGMNAAPSLNLQFLRANGQPLKSTADTEQDSTVAKVYLVESTTIPARKGRFLEATIEPNLGCLNWKCRVCKPKGLVHKKHPSVKLLVPLLNMEFSNSDVKAGDVIGTVELIEEITDDQNLSSSCAQV